MYWCVALLVLLIANASQAKAEPPDERALRLVNHYRQLAGLTLVKLDQQLSAGAWSTRITWCRTEAPTQWPDLMPTPSGRACPAQAPPVRHVPRQLIYFPRSVEIAHYPAGWGSGNVKMQQNPWAWLGNLREARAPPSRHKNSLANNAPRDGAKSRACRRGTLRE